MPDPTNVFKDHGFHFYSEKIEDLPHESSFSLGDNGFEILQAILAVFKKESSLNKEKVTDADDKQEEGDVKNVGSIQPFCITEGKWGYLKFKKNGKKFKIGLKEGQPYKLLRSMTEPFGVAKTIESVFEAIRENIRNKSRAGVYSETMDKRQKLRLIENVIGDLQKGHKLQDKLEFRFDKLKNKMWLEYTE